MLEPAERFGALFVVGFSEVIDPILLAQTIMTDSPHVMLMGEGAEEFARLNGIQFEESSYFDTEFRREQWERVRAQDPNAAAVSESVNLARYMTDKSRANLVNAVLRASLRNPE